VTDRLVLLCEDQLTARFLWKLCERFGKRVIRTQIVGTFTNVIRAYPAVVATRRSKNRQRNLGALVCIDGDNIGVTGRKKELDDELDSRGLERRGAEEDIAVFVPTWSIETWLFALVGERRGENQSVKDEFKARYRKPSEENGVIRRAIENWRGEAAVELPSLVDGYAEAVRVGM
jgi:hypothetical protein